MNFDHLPRQAGAQIGTGTSHDAEAAGDVVHGLGTAAETLVIHRRKIIFQIDTGTDRAVDGEMARQHRAFRIARRVIGNQEGAPVKKCPARHITATDEGTGVGHMSQFRSRLGKVIAATDDMVPRGLRVHAQRCRHQAATTFNGMGGTGSGTIAAQCLSTLAMPFGHVVKVVPEHAIVGRVVFGTHEPGQIGDHDTARQQALPHFRPVGHVGKKPCIGSGMTPGTGAAIVGREMRIVLTVGTVAHDHHQRRKVSGKTKAGQKVADALRLLVVGKAGTRIFRRRRTLAMFRCRRNFDARRRQAVVIEASPAHRKQDAQQQIRKSRRRTHQTLQHTSDKTEAGALQTTVTSRQSRRQPRLP